MTVAIAVATASIVLSAGGVRGEPTTKRSTPVTATKLAFPVTDQPRRELTGLMQRELRGCFDFFWKEWDSDPKSATYGLTDGDYVGLNRYSPIPIESQGFYFAAMVIGVERGWITRAEGRRRTLIAMETLKKLKNIRGFYYHFIDPGTGFRGWKNSPNVELSNGSTGTMIMGALVAGEYFGSDVKELAEELYARVNWRWFTNPVTKHPYLACYPEDKPRRAPRGGMNKDGFFGAWAAYAEHLFLYILGAGAPNRQFATGADSYYVMRTRKGRYKGQEFIFCGSGAAFTYQWTHGFVDFRNMEDPNSWGMSACMSPTTGYSGRYGAKPFGAGHRIIEDGTVPPYGSSAFVVFTPRQSIAALEYMYTISGLVGKYGLYDAYSFATKNDGQKPWIGKSYLGIDKGLVLLMFENYSTQLIWKLFHRSKHIQKALKVLEFKRTG